MGIYYGGRKALLLALFVSAAIAAGSANVGAFATPHASGSEANGANGTPGASVNPVHPLKRAVLRPRFADPAPSGHQALDGSSRTSRSEPAPQTGGSVILDAASVPRRAPASDQPCSHSPPTTICAAA